MKRKPGGADGQPQQIDLGSYESMPCSKSARYRSCGCLAILVGLGLVGFLTYLLVISRPACFDPNRDDASTCQWKCVQHGSACNWCSADAGIVHVCVEGKVGTGNRSCTGLETCSTCTLHANCGDGNTAMGLDYGGLRAMLIVSLLGGLTIVTMGGCCCYDSFSTTLAQDDDRNPVLVIDHESREPLLRNTEPPMNGYDDEPIAELREEKPPKGDIAFSPTSSTRSSGHSASSSQGRRNNFRSKQVKSNDPEEFVNETFRRWGYD